MPSTLEKRNIYKTPSFLKYQFVISNKTDSSIEISIVRPNQPKIIFRVSSQSQTAPSKQDNATR